VDDLVGSAADEAIVILKTKTARQDIAGPPFQKLCCGLHCAAAGFAALFFARLAQQGFA
jgi:hypothetical protein